MSFLKSAKQSINKFFLGNSVGVSTLWNWVTAGSWTRKDLVDQYARKVYAIISLIAENEAKISLQAFTSNKAGEDKPLPSHPLLELLRKPNPQSSQFAFLEFHFTFMKLFGESFWYVVKGVTFKRPLELYHLRPDMIEVAVDEKDPRGLVTGYVLYKPNGERIPLDFDEVLHFKLPSVKNPYRGQGPVESGKVYVQTEESGSKWTLNAILNSGRPSGVMSIKGTITDEQFQKLRRQWKAENTGVDNAGKVLFIKGNDGVEFQKTGMELQEVALDILKKQSQDDLLFMFRMNKAMMGITDDVNKGTAHDADVFLNERIIKPDWDRFLDVINTFLMPTWGENRFLKYKKPSLKSDEQRLEEDKALVDTVKTRNEIRQERGLEPIEGGDFLYIPINQVIVGSTSNAKKMLKKKV